MTSSSNYREYPPGPSLDETVECVWTSAVAPGLRAPSFHRVIPDTAMDLLFDFTASGSRRVAVIGTMTQPLAFHTTGPIDLLGIRFRAGGLSRFLAMNAAELTDRRADLVDFWGGLARELWQRLGESAPAERIPLLRGLLRARATRPGDPFVQHCVKRIEVARGDLQIADMERSTGLSLRQLERKFSRHIGISPKTFARIVRFKAAAAVAERPRPVDWAALASEFGFADQAHLVREFRAFSGLTPVDYRNQNCDARGDVGFLQDAETAFG